MSWPPFSGHIDCPEFSRTYGNSGFDANKLLVNESVDGVITNQGFSIPFGGYDDEDRLLEWDRLNGNAQSWDLSLVGNWDEQVVNGAATSRIHGQMHQIQNMGMASLNHDIKGNQTLNHLGHGRTWDADNFLKSTQTGTVSSNHTYDVFGRRVSSQTTSDTVLYVSDGDQEIAEVFLQVDPYAIQRKYVYGSGIDEPLMHIKVQGATETRYYLHQDIRWNVIGVTNSAGAVDQLYTYTPYGSISYFSGTGFIQSQSTNTNAFYFMGRRLDSPSGLYYFRARYYDVAQGRFISRDPMGIWFDASGKGSGYSTFAQDPINKGDPLGNMADNSLSWNGTIGLCIDSPLEVVKPKKCGQSCGPDITDWLRDEIRHNSNLVRKWIKNRAVTDVGGLHLWKNMVKTRGPWDHKRPLLDMIKGNAECYSENCKGTVTVCGECVQYEAISNIHYGAVGRAAGFMEITLEFGAGWVQPGGGIFSRHFGDEPEDNAAIGIGFDVFGGTDLCVALKSKLSLLKKAPVDCKPCTIKSSPNVKRVSSFSPSQAGGWSPVFE